MKLISKTTSESVAFETTTVELGLIDMHIITKALQLYARKAFELTANEAHAAAAEKLSNEMIDAYCA